jgi:hypothetical protein
MTTIIINKHGLRVLGNPAPVPPWVENSKWAFARMNTESHPDLILVTFWEGANKPDARKWHRIDPPKEK